MWLPDPRDDWELPRWNTFRRTGDLEMSYNSASVHDLAMVISTHTAHARTRVRVSGLFMALHETWATTGARPNNPSPDGNMPRYIALMTDRFTLEANGDFEVI
jgi:hypothetical protein